MYSIDIPENIVINGRKILLVLLLFLFGITIMCCSFFLLLSHDQLADWYTSLNVCFYHSATWSNDFFTQIIKSEGNTYCVLGLIIAICGAFHIIRNFSRQSYVHHLQISVSITDIVYLALGAGVNTCLWVWGNSLALPAFDEVFSAQNVAGIHPFQCVSYYMQPNNHLLFNLINNLFFHPAIDKVATGRIISLLSYCATGVILYFSLLSFFKNRFLSFLTGAVLCTQFFVWGFSFQARAYELYLLAEWGMVLSLFAYIHAPRKRWLYVNLACCIIGYFCLPSFLYIHIAQLLFLTVRSISSKNIGPQVWRYQVYIFAFVFICYLPTLSFSGLGSITNNAYVAPSKFKTASTFWTNMWPLLKTYLAHIFSDIKLVSVDLTILLLALPVILLFADKKNSTVRLIGLFYTFLWLTFFIVANAMKRIPFERNLIGHYNMTLAAVFVFTFWLISVMARNKTSLYQAIYSIVLIGFSIYFLSTYNRLLRDTLYEYNVNEAYQFHSDRLNIIPPGSTVGVSDAEFYSLYLCRTHGCKVFKCPNGDENFFVTQDNEGYPYWLKKNYTLIHKVYNYEIYRHN